MKKVFTYGILQKDHSSDEFGMTDDMHIGRGSLYGFKRNGLCHIYLSENAKDVVIGDIWEVPDELEERLYRFEAQFGYERVKCIVINDSGKFHKCIVYLVDWRS